MNNFEFFAVVIYFLILEALALYFVHPLGNPILDIFTVFYVGICSIPMLKKLGA